MKVLVRAPFSSFSGYGNDGIGMTRALINAGADVYLEPTVVQAPLPEDIAMLLTKRLEAPFDLYINHVDPAALEASHEHRRGVKTTVAWTMWEYTNLGNLPGRSKLAKKIKNFDAVVSYDQVCADAFEPYFKGPRLVVQGGFWPEDWPPVERDWQEENFYFCMVGMLSGRKNPFAAVQAFSELKHEDAEFDKYARLSLKTMTPGLHSAMETVYPGLRVYYEVWSDDVLRQFYQSQHVLLSPSRGEGKNMPALEFQSTGGVVVATDWGGHQQWLNSEYNYGIKNTLVPIDGRHPDTKWAEVDIEDLKKTMLHLFRSREEAKRKGDLAARMIPNSSWPKVIERLMIQLKDSVPNGQELWTKYVMAKDGDTHAGD